MPTLNGKTYEMQYLTDEETAVINAMRRGAKVTATFYESSEVEYQKSLDSSGKVLPYLAFNDCRDGDEPSFVAYKMKNSDYNPSVSILHYVTKPKE